MIWPKLTNQLVVVVVVVNIVFFVQTNRTRITYRKTISITVWHLEHLVHDGLALLIAHEASGISDESTNNAGSEAREEGLHTSVSVNLLSTLSESPDLTLLLLQVLHLESRLHDIQRIDHTPVGNSSNTSSHKAGERALVLHVGQRLVLLQESATVQLVESEVKGHTNHITDQSHAETLPASKNTVHADNLLDSSTDSSELGLVLRVILSTDDLDLKLGLEQIHRSLHKSHGSSGNSSSDESIADGQNLSVTDGLLHLTVYDELDGVVQHISYPSPSPQTTYPKGGK